MNISVTFWLRCYRDLVGLVLIWLFLKKLIYKHITRITDVKCGCTRFIQDFSLLFWLNAVILVLDLKYRR